MITAVAEILTVLFIGSEFCQLGFTRCFSWELNIPKLLVVEEVGGALIFVGSFIFGLGKKNFLRISN